MLILSIDTSTIAASAALTEDNKLIGEVFTDFKLKHSEKIMFTVDALLKNTHMSIGDADVFAVGRGPGSFTGIRIGAAAVKGFAQALNKPIVGISSLKACAYAHAVFDGLICPVFDAQRDSLYSSLYEASNGALLTAEEDCVITLKELSGKIKSYNKKVLFCGDAAEKYKNEFTEELGEKAVFAPYVSMMPRASWVGFLAKEEYEKGNVSSYADFLPVYIRKSQAEVNYKVLKE